ncbi:hypothetical protein [Shewanella metallivivens]|uniref:Apea-like HEPN domain-containing protein n=1 Tax=Shewanella metallivivens TaxID=2872342 RepID=A0ABT5TSU1_9GAMM|nr:hypothetical protein [Shewanella metallivivens]MDD8060765.1 hypothetical protein [Shewanella metallivivens]
MRQSLWMISNVGKLDATYERSVLINGELIELYFTNFENSHQIPEPIADWIENKIVRTSMWIPLNLPSPMDCCFIFTKNKCSEENQEQISQIISLCLSLILPPPVLISRPGQYIENAAIVNPSWNYIPNPNRVINKIIGKTEINSIVELISRFGEKKKARYPYFHEILKLSSINDVLIETLSLWAFIEGFWNVPNRKSDLSGSFMNMLTTDRFPGTRNKSPQVKALKQQIMVQNEMLGAQDFSNLRNIIAHGTYLKLEDTWTTEQWNAIYSQRDLLLHTVLIALSEYNLRNA